MACGGDDRTYDHDDYDWYIHSYPDLRELVGDVRTHKQQLLRLYTPDPAKFKVALIDMGLPARKARRVVAEILRGTARVAPA